MANKDNIVIDNDSQAIYVNGKKWEKSPESYMHLKDRMQQRRELVQSLQGVDLTKMYRQVQSLA